MNNSDNKNLLTVCIFLIIGVILAVMQTVCDYFFFDASVYLYEYGTAVPLILNFVFLAYIIAALVFFGIRAKSLPGEYPPSIHRPRALSLLCGVTILATGVNDLITYIGKRSELMYVPSRQDTFLMWSGITCVVAAAYFVINSFLGSKKPTVCVLTGCVTVVWHIMRILVIYFDMTNPLNNPMRLMNEFALVAGMLYIASEIRFMLKAPKKGLYVSASLIAFTLLLTSSVSGIVVMAAGILPADRSALCRSYELALALYILFRVVFYARQDVNEEAVKAADDVTDNQESSAA